MVHTRVTYPGVSTPTTAARTRIQAAYPTATVVTNRPSHSTARSGLKLKESSPSNPWLTRDRSRQRLPPPERRTLS